jgi:hypothetical protein
LCNQHSIFALSLCVLCFDGLQNRAQSVQQVQQSRDDRAVGSHLALAQQTQQILSGVRQLLQPLEPQESSRPLDRVH